MEPSTPFDCPIPPRLSPHADAAQEWLNAWLADADPPLDGMAVDRLRQAAVARYAGRLFPEADEGDLRTLSALFTWFFLVDDWCDGPNRPTPERVHAFRDGVLLLLRAGAGHPHPGFTGPLRRLLADAWREPHRRMPARWRSRFVDAVAHHFEGVGLEAANRAAGRAPSVAEYLPLRRATSAAYVSYTLIEFVTGRPLPDAVYHHPTLAELAGTANDLLSWFNDVVSLDGDRVTSGGHNLVLAVAREQDVSLEVAVELVVPRWRSAMARFEELRAAVPAFGPGLDEAVAHYLDGLACSVRGTIDWSLDTTRYPVTGGAPGRGGRRGTGRCRRNHSR